MDTTTTYRDYAFEDLAGGEFSINTSGDVAVMRSADNHPELAIEITFSPDQARELGTDLLGFVGSPLSCGSVDYDTANGANLTVNIEDGNVDIHVASADGTARSNYELRQEQTIDLGQRLIVWAGVATQVAADV